MVKQSCIVRRFRLCSGQPELTCASAHYTAPLSEREVHKGTHPIYSESYVQELKRFS
uniref:Uncharacterized protein n=1 Tax=Anguilla anguilla TaxID=7936 RepID=A0A0E9TFU2_ANGAN